MPRKTEEKVIFLTDNNESKQWIYLIFTKPNFIISSQDFIIIMDRLTCFYFLNKFFSRNYFIAAPLSYIIPINNLRLRQEGLFCWALCFGTSTPACLNHQCKILQAKWQQCTSGSCAPLLGHVLSSWGSRMPFPNNQPLTPRFFTDFLSTLSS